MSDATLVGRDEATPRLPAQSSQPVASLASLDTRAFRQDDGSVRDRGDRDHGAHEWLRPRDDRERRHFCLARSLARAGRHQPARQHVQHHSASWRIRDQHPERAPGGAVAPLRRRQDPARSPPACASSPIPTMARRTSSTLSRPFAAASRGCSTAGITSSCSAASSTSATARRPRRWSTSATATARCATCTAPSTAESAADFFRPIGRRVEESAP